MLEPGATFKELMKAIGKRTTSLVNVSIVVLIITGIILAIFSKSSAVWSQILLVKHGVVFFMVAIHLGRNKVIAPKLRKMALKDSTSHSFVRLQKLQRTLV